MDKPTRLYRGDSYPYEQENPSYYEAIETRNGVYSVTIDLMTDAFILTNPAGKLVEDSFHNFHKRKDLYDNYNEAIYEWLVMVRDKMNQARSQYGETRSWFIVDDVKYEMRINTENSMVYLYLPSQTRVFTVKNMYLENVDLSLIQEGLLNDEIRKRLERKGFKLPRIPYQVGIGISMTPKITIPSDEQ